MSFYYHNINACIMSSYYLHINYFVITPGKEGREERAQRPVRAGQLLLRAIKEQEEQAAAGEGLPPSQEARGEEGQRRQGGGGIFV